MRVLVITLLLVLAGRLAAPSEATAQYHRLTDAIVVGGTVAAAGSGAESFAGGPEIGALIEVPIGDAYRAARAKPRPAPGTSTGIPTTAYPAAG